MIQCFSSIQLSDLRNAPKYILTPFKTFRTIYSIFISSQNPIYSRVDCRKSIHSEKYLIIIILKITVQSHNKVLRQIIHLNLLILQLFSSLDIYSLDIYSSNANYRDVSLDGCTQIYSIHVRILDFFGNSEYP